MSQVVHLENKSPVDWIFLLPCISGFTVETTLLCDIMMRGHIPPSEKTSAYHIVPQFQLPHSIGFSERSAQTHRLNFRKKIMHLFSVMNHKCEQVFVLLRSMRRRQWPCCFILSSSVRIWLLFPDFALSGVLHLDGEQSEVCVTFYLYLNSCDEAGIQSLETRDPS